MSYRLILLTFLGFWVSKFSTRRIRLEKKNHVKKIRKQAWLKKPVFAGVVDTPVDWLKILLIRVDWLVWGYNHIFTEEGFERVNEISTSAF